MRHSEAGKGSRARDVDKEKYESNYDTIFGKKKEVCLGVKKDSCGVPKTQAESVEANIKNQVEK